jgi:hypothetical protein
MHVDFQNYVFYNEKVKGVKVYGACWQWDDSTIT